MSVQPEVRDAHRTLTPFSLMPSQDKPNAVCPTYLSPMNTDTTIYIHCYHLPFKSAYFEATSSGWGGGGLEVGGMKCGLVYFRTTIVVVDDAFFCTAVQIQVQLTHLTPSFIQNSIY